MVDIEALLAYLDESMGVGAGMVPRLCAAAVSEKIDHIEVGWL